MKKIIFILALLVLSSNLFSQGQKFDITYINDVSTDSISVINDIHFINEYTGFVSAVKWRFHDNQYFQDKQYIYKTTNGGFNWSKKWDDLNIINSPKIPVYFINQSTGYFLNHNHLGNSVLYKTTDGGDTWGVENTAGGITPANSVIRYNNQNSGFMLKYETSPILYSLPSFDDVYNFGQNISLTDFDFSKVDPNIIYVTGYKYSSPSNPFLAKSTDGGTNWTLLNTPETRTRLLSVDATPGGRVIAVGENSTVLVSGDFGNSWMQVDFGLPGVYIGGVKLVNENISYFVGYTGTIVFQARIYKSTDGGLSWTHLPSPTAALISIDFYNEDYGIVSGRNATYITTNGGQTWNAQSINYSFISIGKCVKFIDSLTIGLTLQKDATVHPAFNITTNGGQNWNMYNYSLPNVEGFIDQVEGHTFIDNNTGYMVSRYGRVMKTINGGVNWQYQETYTNLWWIESLSDNFITACGYGGTILRSTDSGNDWNTLLGGYQPLNHLVFVNQSTGFACGNRGSIIKTTDVGETWQDLNSGVTVKLNQLHFINETTGYCVGDTGTFLKTTNAGDTWEVQNSGTTSELWSVYFHNDQKGTIGAMGRIITTIDGGSSWKTQMFSTFDRFYSLLFVNEMIGSTAHDGDIYRTTDGGFNWNLVFSQNTYTANLFFVDNEYGFYLGRNRIARTTNGGANWVHQIINYEFGRRNIYFGSRNIGLASYNNGVFSGGMNKTIDGGNTWFEYPIVSANANNWITFINANTGVAVDWRGCIIKTTNEIMTDVETVSNILPDKIELFQNYPNPFNSETKIKFSIHKSSNVKINVTDVTGRSVSEIVNSAYSPGTYEVSFNAGGLPSGIYFYSMYSNNIFIQTKKLILLK